MLRAALAHDVPALLSLGQVCGLSWNEQHLLLQLGASSACVVVVVDDGCVVGALSAQLLGDEAELFDLAILPAYRRRGWAARLIQQLCATASARGCCQVVLEVASDNGPARALYAGLGFTQQGLRPGYYGRGVGPAVDALVLVLALTNPASP